MLAVIGGIGVFSLFHQGDESGERGHAGSAKVVSHIYGNGLGCGAGEGTVDLSFVRFGDSNHVGKEVVAD